VETVQTIALIGTAMGIHPSPSYANIFMAKLDDHIVKGT